MKKKDIRRLHQARQFMGEERHFDGLLRKFVENRKFRLNFLLKMRTARALLVDRQEFSLVKKVDDLKMDIAGLFDEMNPVAEDNREGPVQSYLNTCPVLLRHQRLTSLSYYDNRRDRYPVDRYYFGSYGGFRE